MDGNWYIAPNLSRHGPKKMVKIFYHFDLGRDWWRVCGTVFRTASPKQGYKNRLDCGNPINLQRA